ncbi:DUF6284 family protein [Dactylosporangium sp. CA-233914]|uniref:DUF6284 family protein n=1 Tax=Dactylosporangium sp. CA-233914 TaxID=3239934 RepID=UPI003D9437A2
MNNDRDDPSPADLAAIEAEMPLIEAEMKLLDAEIRILLADPEPTALDWQRMRRAERLVMRELVKLHTLRPTERSAARRLRAA